MIKLYSRIFATIIPYRIFFCRIDDVSLNFLWFVKRYQRFLPIGKNFFVVVNIIFCY